MAYFGLPDRFADVPTCAHLAQPDVDESDLVDEAALEAVTALEQFQTFRLMGNVEDCLTLLHPDCVISTLVGTVEGEEPLRAMLLDWSMYSRLKQEWSAWKFVNHDLDQDRVSPVQSRDRLKRPPAGSASAVGVYNSLRRIQRPNDKSVEDLSTRFVLERTGKTSRSFKLSDIRKFHIRESAVVIDGLIRLYCQQIIE
jgi:hypothetical protein